MAVGECSQPAEPAYLDASAGLSPACGLLEIAEHVGMCVSTVRKYVAELEERLLIRTERTTITTKDGRKRNGCLRYHILPIQMSINQYYERQLDRAGLALEQYRAERSAAALDRKEGVSKC